MGDDDLIFQIEEPVFRRFVLDQKQADIEKDAIFTFRDRKDDVSVSLESDLGKTLYSRSLRLPNHGFAPFRQSLVTVSFLETRERCPVDGIHENTAKKFPRLDAFLLDRCGIVHFSSNREAGRDVI